MSPRTALSKDRTGNSWNSPTLLRGAGAFRGLRADGCNACRSHSMPCLRTVLVHSTPASRVPVRTFAHLRAIQLAEQIDEQDVQDVPGLIPRSAARCKHAASVRVDRPGRDIGRTTSWAGPFLQAPRIAGFMSQRSLFRSDHLDRHQQFAQRGSGTARQPGRTLCQPSASPAFAP